MLSKLPQEFRKFIRHYNTLKRILNETQRSLDEISSTNLFPGEDLKEQLLGENVIQSLRKILECSPALLIYGQNCHAKALFVNYILGQVLLPLHGSTWRWIRILHGITKRIRLTLADEYEFVENYGVQDHSWHVVPEQDLHRLENEIPLEHCPSLEVELYHPLLKDNVQIIIPPDCSPEELLDISTKGLDKIWPVIIYVIVDAKLTDENIKEIRKLKEIYPDLPFLFVSMSENVENMCNSTTELTESEQHHLEQTATNSMLHNHCKNKLFVEKRQYLRHQLESLGYISEKTNEQSYRNSCCGDCAIDNAFISEDEIIDKFMIFVQGCLKSHLLKMAALLSEIHNNCLRKFILSAFDMAREIQITPRRILYAQAREAELYRTLMNIASEKQEEITRLIQVTLQEMRSNISEVVQDCQNISQTISTSEIQQLVLRKLCNSVATQLVRSVDCLQDSFIGTLQRCLESLERNCNEQEVNLMASVAVKQILSAAYKIDLKSSTTFSVVHTFWERLRNILYTLQMPWTHSSYSHYDPHRRRQIVATEMIDSLSASKLARNISAQFKEHVKASHDAFQMAMRTLENHLSGKLEQTEEQRIAIRKYHAPRFAKLALESTSMCDMVRWGMPQQTKEIGRGQYGVVFACEPWAGIDPCAVKSVVPPDERHWNDLAMEFYYTRTIPEHIRIVRLRGSVVDQSYGGGCSAVLLIMERMNRDLYCGLRSGLSWQKRLQIAIDVVEGIRYLHSQGLVHRDIKLKNVLLDAEDRAKLTDFGFCIPEAMMSGSVVGTPVHMAPELLSGHYDSSVDVYAFGILFWYICAGHVKLPCVFEHFQNKEQLWSSVRKGIRPECLPQFNEACWNLMEQCWAAEPVCRPLLGYVQPQLEAIMRNSCGQDSDTDS